MRFRYLILLVALLASQAPLARADIFHGVDFSCTAVPQANLNGVTMASEVRTVAKNVSGKKLVIRYHVLVTSSQGRVEDYDYTRGGQRGTFIPQAVESHSSTPFSKASVQDEFPQTCQFKRIQVCPADPPANFPKGVYFRPFIDGGRECKELGSVSTVLAAPKATSGCTAITKTWAMTEGYGHHYVYAIGTASVDLDSAIAKAVVPSNDVEQSAVVMVKGCGQAHGAIAASLKHQSCYEANCPFLADGIYEEMAAALADSKDAAEQQALSGCHNSSMYKRAPNMDACVIIKSW